MNEIKCEVIKDLLPLYVDEICSEASKELVEGHIEKCGVCRAVLITIKETEIFTKPCEPKELDYMKRVKKYYTNKSIMGFILLILMLLIGTIAMTFNCIPPNINFIIMPILMFTSYYVLSSYSIESKSSKWYKLLCIVSMFLIGYTIILMELSIHWVKKEFYPFGLQAYEVGPFVYRQILVNALLQIGIYLRVMYLGLKNQKGYSLLISFSLAGACIDMGYISLLSELSDITYYNTVRNNNILIIALSSIVITGVIEFLRRKK